jgi:hypothetical protein
MVIGTLPRCTHHDRPRGSQSQAADSRGSACFAPAAAGTWPTHEDQIDPASAGASLPLTCYSMKDLRLEPISGLEIILARSRSTVDDCSYIAARDANGIWRASPGNPAGKQRMLGSFKCIFSTTRRLGNGYRNRVLEWLRTFGIGFLSLNVMEYELGASLKYYLDHMVLMNTY